jgi:hypothetical protein
MAKIGNIIGGCFITLGLLIPATANAEPNTGTGPTTFDCTGVSPNCGAWAPKGPNTCRTCQQAQCKTENGKEVVAGNKTTTEYYEGHGSPPASTGSPKGGQFNKAPSTGTMKQQ